MSDTRARVQRTIEALIVDEHGQDAIKFAPINSSLSFQLPRPSNYLDGIDAALRVGRVAEAIARDYAKKARGEGASWREVATALGFDLETTSDPSGAAFRWVAPEPSQPFDRILTWWECASCGSRIADSGSHGHPDDEEEGHASDCARHNAETAAFEREMDND